MRNQSRILLSIFTFIFSFSIFANDGSKNTKIVCNNNENFKETAISSGQRSWHLELLNGNYDLSIETHKLSDEKSLLKAAEEGDAEAMYVLGMRYRWSSHDMNPDNGYGALNRSSANNKPRPKLDRDLMKKAQHWLYQSALHGELAGLIDYRQALNIERGKRSQTGDITPEESNEMIAISIAHDLLVDWVAPEYAAYRDFSHYPHPDIPNMVEHYNNVYDLLDELKLEWKNERLVLDLPVRLNVKIPEEVKEWRQRYVQCVLCKMEHIKRDKRFSSCSYD